LTKSVESISELEVVRTLLKKVDKQFFNDLIVPFMSTPFYIRLN